MRILVTEPEWFSPEAVRRLEEAGFHVTLYVDALSGVGDVLTDYDGVIVRFGVRWNRDLLARAPRLRFLATPTTGVDHIDLGAVREAGSISPRTAARHGKS